jgi:hypothetical protein
MTHVSHAGQQAAAKDNINKVGAILFGSATPKPAPKPRLTNTLVRPSTPASKPQPPIAAPLPEAPNESASSGGKGTSLHRGLIRMRHCWRKARG